MVSGFGQDCQRGSFVCCYLETIAYVAFGCIKFVLGVSSACLEDSCARSVLQNGKSDALRWR